MTVLVIDILDNDDDVGSGVQRVAMVERERWTPMVNAQWPMGTHQLKYDGQRSGAMDGRV